MKSALAELAGGIMGKASNCVSLVTNLLLIVLLEPQERVLDNTAHPQFTIGGMDKAAEPVRQARPGSKGPVHY